MNPRTLPVTTRTVEITQLTDLNEQLIKRVLAPVTAVELGLDQAKLFRQNASRRLDGTAVLARLGWEGPPEYPYVHAHFGGVAGQAGTVVVEMHTRALLALSHRLGLRHRWGF